MAIKMFFAEYIKDYSTYTFSYVPYAVFRSEMEMTEIYDAGFLPYTGNINLDHYLYYKARSLRVDLSEWEMSSENRRVNRKFEASVVDTTWHDVKYFGVDEAEFQSFCSEYSRQRFKGGEMETDRLNYVLGSPFLTYIIEFRIDGKRAGYVFVGQNADLIHYWYSFYELEDFKDLPLGKFMMLEVIRQAKEQGLRYCYLGTCYGAHSLYKVRDFKEVEFYDGSGWNRDVKQLKEWCKSDDEHPTLDRFKKLTPEMANHKIGKLLNVEEK